MKAQWRKETGGSVDILLVEKIDGRRWSCLVRGLKKGILDARVHVGEALLRVTTGGPYWTCEFPEGLDAEAVMARYGRVPLPRYIRRGENGRAADDAERYQTVYARCAGSIAAPTAGLHFDEDLLGRVEAMGVTVAKVTLHIGVGTFFLIKSEEVEGHEMHGEHYSVTPDCLEAVERTKERGGRVIAVGTSAVRTLETVWPAGHTPLAGRTRLFIYPGYEFRVVDGLITNFHLPRSTPLVLVSAFAGKGAIEKAYREAIVQGYRFYSYGDAMFIS